MILIESNVFVDFFGGNILNWLENEVATQKLALLHGRERFSGLVLFSNSLSG